MLKPALTLAVMLALVGSAMAGDRHRDRGPVPPREAARQYGPVHNYYGPVTVYAAPGAGYPVYPATNYPVYGNSYSYGYATAPECDANCYGAGYDWGGRYDYGYSYGGGYAVPSYGYGYGYPPANEGARLSPWNGYYGGFGNGYW